MQASGLDNKCEMGVVLMNSCKMEGKILFSTLRAIRIENLTISPSENSNYRKAFQKLF